MPRLDPQLTAQLLSIWHAAASVSPTAGPAPAPAPVVSARTFQVVRAVKPVLATRGGSFSAFVAAWIGNPNDQAVADLAAVWAAAPTFAS